MKIKSPLADTAEVLQQIRLSAELYEGIFRNNESSTRAALIDPVLRVLGWDTGNPAMVEVEKYISKSRVDYALLDANGEIKVIVEAKKLGEDLHNQDIILSLVKYAFTSGVSDIFLSDGLTWHHYREFNPGNLQPGRIIDLQRDDLIEAAAYLVRQIDAAHYWALGTDVDELAQQIRTLENAIGNMERELSRIKETKPSEVDKPKHEPFPRFSTTGELVLLEDIPNATRTSPSLLRLPDGTTFSVSWWSDVLRECVKYAMEKNPNIHLPLPDAAGKKINIIGLVRPLKQISYTEMKYQGRQVFVYENYDSNHCILNALHVLKQVPKSEMKERPAVKYA